MKALAVLVGLFGLLLFLELPGSWLIDPDESRYAEIPREMLASGDYVTPRLNDAHYFEKPPLLYWTNALWIKALGPTPFATRLTARLSALATAACLAAALEAPAGLWAALLFLSTPLGFVLGRFNVIDGLLSFWLTASFLCLRAWLLRREEDKPAGPWLWGLGASTGLAFLAKGLVAVALPGLAFLIWIAVMKRWKRLAEFLLSPAPPVFLAIILPWLVLIERANPGFARFFFIHEHFMRYATSVHGRGLPVYTFTAVFLASFLPWTFCFASALKPLWPPRLEALRRKPDDLFLALWFFVILAFFSLSKSQLLTYILPAFPAAAALAGRSIVAGPPPRRALLAHACVWTLAFAAGLAAGELWLVNHNVLGEAILAAALFVSGAWAAVALSRRRAETAWLAAASGWGGFYLAAILALPALARDLSSHGLAVAAGAAGERVVAYHCYPQSFPWELKRPIIVANYKDELGSDGVLPPDLYWSREEFFKRWNAGERLAVVARRKDLHDFGENAPARAILARNDGLVLITNYVPR